MSEEINARHIASFLEHDDPLNEEEILQNLRTVTALPNRSVLDCHLSIIEDEYLTVRIETDKDPSECFDLKCIDNISGFTSKSKGSNFSYLLIFRFHASKLTGGECPNEIHIFDMDDEATLEWAVDTIFSAVNNAKSAHRDQKTKKSEIKRSMSKRKDAVDRLNKMRRVPQSQGEGTEDKLEDLNHLLDDIENFEAILHDSISFQVSNSSKADRSLWRDSLSPPTLDTAKENIEKIRTCINFTADLKQLIVDPGPEDLLNRLFESLWWIQKICDCNRVLHFHSNLIRSVWRPTFTNQTIKLLNEYLQPANKAFWNELGSAWTQPGGKPDSYSEDKEDAHLKKSTIDRERKLKPELTIRDYGYYKPAPTISSIPTLKEETPVDIEGFINGVRERGGKLVVIKQRHLSEATKELSVNIGEVLEILDDGDEWCCLRTPSGATGHVPKKCFEILEDHSTKQSGKSRTLPRLRSQSPLDRAKKSHVNKRSSRSSSESTDDQDTEYSKPLDHHYPKRQDSQLKSQVNHGMYVSNQTTASNQPQVQFIPSSQYNTGQVQPLTQRNIIQPANGTQPSVIVVPSQNAQSSNGGAQAYAQPIIQQGNRNQPSVIVVPSQTAGGSSHYIVTPTAQNPAPRRPPQPTNVIVPIPMPSPMPHVMSSPMLPSMGYQMPYSMGQQPYNPQMYPGMMNTAMSMYNTQMNPYRINQYGSQQYPFGPALDPYGGVYDNYGKNYVSDFDRYQQDGHVSERYGRRERHRSQSPRRKTTKHKSRKDKKGNSNRSSSDSSSSAESTKRSHKNKKHNNYESSSEASMAYHIPPAPPVPPPLSDNMGIDTFDIISQAVRKQRNLGFRPPAHTDTLNKELKDRIRNMQIGLGNGLKPAVKRVNSGSHNSSLRSTNDPPAEINRLAATFETATV